MIKDDPWGWHVYLVLGFCALVVVSYYSFYIGIIILVGQYFPIIFTLVKLIGMIALGIIALAVVVSGVYYIFKKR